MTPAPGRIARVDDDAQGQPLEVLSEKEVDAEVLGETSWAKVADKGFDPPRIFSAYLHTLRWQLRSMLEASQEALGM